jgi:hypothetical protein
MHKVLPGLSNADFHNSSGLWHVMQSRDHSVNKLYFWKHPICASGGGGGGGGGGKGGGGEGGGGGRGRGERADFAGALRLQNHRFE